MILVCTADTTAAYVSTTASFDENTGTATAGPSVTAATGPDAGGTPATGTGSESYTQGRVECNVISSLGVIHLQYYSR